jgi:hypothetical protein
MDYIDTMERDVERIFSNYEESYYYIAAMVRMSPNMYDLHVALREYYEACIDAVLRETPENSMGNRLVNEICRNLPAEVFDRLASNYWEMKEEA